MSRARRVNQEEMARRYIYDQDSRPISLTGISDEFGVSRPYVAEMAGRGAGTSMPGKSWYEQRREFRLTVGEKVIAALADEWAETQAALQRRMLQTSVNLLDKFDDDLAEGRITLSAKDFPAIRDSIRSLIGDMAASSQRDEAKIINPDEMVVDPEKFVEALPMLKRLLEGGGNGAGAAFAGIAGDDAAPDAAGTLKD